MTKLNSLKLNEIRRIHITQAVGYKKRLVDAVL